MGAKIKHRRDAGEEGECYSYWRRFRNYVPGSFGLGRSGLGIEVLRGQLKGKKRKMGTEKDGEERKEKIAKVEIGNVEDAKLEDAEAKMELLENKEVIVETTS